MSFHKILYITILLPGLVVAQNSQLPQNLAVYYGFPSSVNQTFDAAAAADEFADYELIIFADPLQFPQPTGGPGEVDLYGCDQNRHLDHDNTEQIIALLNAAGKQVFGYVSLGGANTNRICNSVKTPLLFDDPTPINSLDPLGIRGDIVSRVDRWIDMGVTGIFLDEAGYDFETDRARQIQTIDYVHNVKNLPVFVNAWNPYDIFSADVEALMNPSGLASPMEARDIFLIESFAVIQGAYRTETDWLNRSDMMWSYRQQFGTEVAVVTTTQDATCDVGGFMASDQEQFDYAWWTAFLYGFEYMGWGEGSNYSASGACNGSLPFRTRPNPVGVGDAVLPISVGHDLNSIHLRTTTTGTIEVDAFNHTGQFITGLPTPGACTASPLDLQNWWPAEGMDDDIVSGHDGTLAPLKSWFVPGKVGEAFSFDGFDDVIPFGTGPALTGISGIAVEAWVKTDTDGIIIQQRDETGTGYDGQYILSIGGLTDFAQDPGKVCWGSFADGSHGFNFCGITSVDDGAYHHIAAVREDDGTGRIYVDGVLDQSQTASAVALKTLKVYMGADPRNTNQRFFKGSIDEASIYNRALLASEIQSIFNAGDGGKCQDPLEADRLALEALYNATNGATWTNNTGWLSPDVSTWFGVTVAAGRVTRVEMVNNNLNGSLPGDLGDLTALELLRLGSNQLAGPIPTELGYLPDLFELHLGNNQLSGDLPASIGNLVSLTNMTLWYNEFTGSIPATFANLSLLEFLRLTNNNLTGTIPAGLGGLANLQRLELTTNGLTGNIPATLGQLGALEILRLGSNNLDGPIPSELGDLSVMFELDLGNNQLSGDLPASLGQLSALTNMTLWNNEMTGSIPATFADLNLLEFMRLTNNNLTGTIPASLGGLANLQRLELTANGLTGNIPATFGQLGALEILRLGSNNLDEPIPSELGDLSVMFELDLGNNQLSGDLPASLGDLSALTNMTVWNNNLTGFIPASLGNLNLLQILRLSNNTFTGPIPPEIGNLSNLVIFEASGNTLSGSIPPELGTIGAMEVINMNGNALTGDVPASFADLSNLTTLFLSANDLTGLPDLSGLANLSTLVVQTNRLSFEDLEPNAGVATFTYNPQSPFGNPVTLFVDTGGTLDLFFPGGGASDIYQWYKDSMPIAGATSGNHTITGATLSDAGDYYLEVTNAVVTGLTIQSEVLTVELGTAPYSGEPVSFWGLNEGTGITASDREDSNAGTLINGPVWTSGIVGGALHFDGVDDYVDMEVNTNLQFGTDDVTLEAWIKPDRIGVGGSEVIAGQYFNYPIFHFRIAGDGTLASRIGFDGTQNFEAASGGQSVTDGQWHHVAVVFDRDGFMTRYVDGAAYGAPTDISSTSGLSLSIPDAFSRRFRIGASGSTATLTQLFDGKIDEVAIYRAALTPAEILARYDRGNAAVTPTGTDVTVQPVDATTSTSPISLTFTEVATGGAGVTTVQSGSSGPPPPTGFQLGDPPTYYDLETTAMFTPPIEVCIDFSGIVVGNEEVLRLYHYENDEWLDQTVEGYPQNGIICASVSSLSPFAVFEREDESTDTPPLAGPITGPVDPAQVQTNVSLSAAFTDVNLTEDHTAVWDWADGTQCDTAAPPSEPEESCAVVEGNTGAGTLSGTHTYGEPGVYKVTLTVTDEAGLFDEEFFQYVVIYDPEGGFVTGGGWIDSPEGAYVADPTLTGKAYFGFVSKYKKGKSVPEGETEFNFNVADLNFHSTAYEWLVIAGPKAQYKGSGIINGLGNYGFMLTATDEKITPSTDEDLFRIKIWDIDDEDAIVYDNKLGEEDDSDAGTVLGGGNVVIHSSNGNGNSANNVTDELTGLGDKESEVPDEFILDGNYPNPFNPITTIRFGVPEAAEVQLVIYNIIGQEIKRLVNGIHDPGMYEVQFDAGRLSSGIYFYRLETPEGSFIRKMMLLK